MTTFYIDIVELTLWAMIGTSFLIYSLISGQKHYFLAAGITALTIFEHMDCFLMIVPEPLFLKALIYPVIIILISHFYLYEFGGFHIRIVKRLTYSLSVISVVTVILIIITKDNINSTFFIVYIILAALFGVGAFGTMFIKVPNRTQKIIFTLITLPQFIYVLITWPLGLFSLININPLLIGFIALFLALIRKLCKGYDWNTTSLHSRVMNMKSFSHDFTTTLFLLRSSVYDINSGDYKTGSDKINYSIDALKNNVQIALDMSLKKDEQGTKRVGEEIDIIKQISELLKQSNSILLNKMQIDVECIGESTVCTSRVYLYKLLSSIFQYTLKKNGNPRLRFQFNKQDGLNKLLISADEKLFPPEIIRKIARGNENEEIFGNKTDLDIIYLCIEKINGTIQQNQKRNKITITFPDFQKVQKPRLDSKNDLKGKDILIVEDEPGNMALMQKYLSDEMAIPRASRTAEHAMQQIQKRKPDIIILDNQLGEGLNGIELCRELRRKYKKEELVIIMISASYFDELFREGYAVGLNDFITKDVDRKEFINRIKKMLIA